MINENEIRIGNWFHHTEQWSTMQGDNTLDSFDFKWTSSSWYQIGECLLSLEVLEPIPLTENWLLKFGFNKDYKQGYVGIDVNNSDFVLTEPLVIGEWQTNYIFQFNAGNLSKFTELKYVHQLQNLFFTITGKELELT